MSIVIFLSAEALGLIALYLTWRGVFGIGFAFLVVLVMLALSFHVMARRPRADGTSVRMASFAAMLWYATLMSGKLFLEFRGWAPTLLSGLFSAIVGSVAVFATWSVVERPLDYDVEESE